MAYKTTFNYALTHIVMPRMFLHDLEFFYQTILPNPENMQIFMKNAINECGKIAKEHPEVEPPHEIKDFQMGMFGDNREQALLFINGFPKATQRCDTFEVAISFNKKQPRYFTTELGLSTDNKPYIVLGEWKMGQGDKLDHHNHGVVNPMQEGAIPKAIIEVMYGKK